MVPANAHFAQEQSTECFAQRSLGSPCYPQARYSVRPMTQRALRGSHSGHPNLRSASKLHGFVPSV